MTKLAVANLFWARPKSRLVNTLAI